MLLVREVDWIRQLFLSWVARLWGAESARSPAIEKKKFLERKASDASAVSICFDPKTTAS